MRRLLLMLMLLSLVGCQLPAFVPPSTPGPVESARTSVPALSGRALFVAERQAQAAMTDVAVAATVSLINTGTNQTEATTLTDGSGRFVLTFATGFHPDPSATYYLEAVKGLNNNRPSSNVARVRTIAKFQGGWTTLTAGAIVISRSTTALSIGAALKQGTATPVDFDALIGKLAPGATSEQDVYTPVINLSGTDFTTLLGLVTTNLTADKDPVATLGYNAGSGAWTSLGSGGGFAVTSATPATGGSGTSVAIAGTGFSTTPASNSVSFAGVSATVTAASATSLTTSVPTGAVSGQVVVTVGGTSALGPLFTVPVAVSGFSPASGTAGTTVTVTGSGFSATVADDLVLFDGKQATVTGATATTLTVTVPATTTGKVSVHVKGVSGTSAADFTYGSPMLTSLNPAIAVTGSTITLEGSFGTTATVNFLGAGSVAATVLGPNRVEVTVPAGAVSGDLTVTTGGLTTNAQPFRKATYGLGLQTAVLRPHQGDTVRQASRLSVGRSYFGTAVVGNYLYVIGGRIAGGTDVTSIERATLNADGTLGSFSVVPGVSLNQAGNGGIVLVIGSYLYALGGTNVERATIYADGSISTFTTVDTTLGRGSYAATVIGSYLYVIGGGSPVKNTVLRAPINGDGTIGSFTAIAQTLNKARDRHTCTVAGNYLYVMGGFDGTANTNSVERAPINADGTIGAFSTVSTLATARYHIFSFVQGGYLYVAGGASTAIERAPLNADGTLAGGFATMAGASLTTSRLTYSDTFALVGNYLYVLGGWNGSQDLDLVEQLSLDGTSNLGNFSYAADMPTPRLGHSIAVVGRNLYLVAGHSASGVYENNVVRATIYPDGSLGPYSVVPNSGFVTPRTVHTSAVIGNYLYVIGGQGASGNLTSVERAAINPDGTLGTFSTVPGVALTQTRSYATSLVSGNYLYVIGGVTAANSWDNSIERATINADGTIGNFAPAGITLVTGRHRLSSVVIGNYAYAIGGVISAGTTNVVERASINADGSLNAFTTDSATLATGRIEPTLTVVGSYLYAIAGANHSLGCLTTLDRALINSDGTIGTFAAVSGVTLGTGRGLQRGVAVGNHLYVTGGYTAGSGNNSVSSVEDALLQ